MIQLNSYELQSGITIIMNTHTYVMYYLPHLKKEMNNLL